MHSSIFLHCCRRCAPRQLSATPLRRSSIYTSYFISIRVLFSCITLVATKELFCFVHFVILLSLVVSVFDFSWASTWHSQPEKNTEQQTRTKMHSKKYIKKTRCIRNTTNAYTIPCACTPKALHQYSYSDAYSYDIAEQNETGFFLEFHCSVRQCIMNAVAAWPGEPGEPGEWRPCRGRRRQLRSE